MVKFKPFSELNEVQDFSWLSRPIWTLSWANPNEVHIRFCVADPGIRTMNLNHDQVSLLLPSLVDERTIQTRTSDCRTTNFTISKRFTFVEMSMVNNWLSSSHISCPLQVRIAISINFRLWFDTARSRTFRIEWDFTTPSLKVAWPDDIKIFQN